MLEAVMNSKRSVLVLSLLALLFLPAGGALAAAQLTAAVGTTSGDDALEGRGGVADGEDLARNRSLDDNRTRRTTVKPNHVASKTGVRTWLRITASHQVMSRLGRFLPGDSRVLIGTERIVRCFRFVLGLARRVPLPHQLDGLDHRRDARLDLCAALT